jgi:hypothetical protein
MKFFLLFFIGFVWKPADAQTEAKNPWAFSKRDIAPMTLQLTAGYAQGWREEILYHPKALFEHYPKLNHNFWDDRINHGSNGISVFRDANHLLKFIVVGTQTVAIVIKVGDWKDYSKKDRWKKLLGDLLKYYGAYKLGFVLSYNVSHHNKFSL